MKPHTLALLLIGAQVSGASLLLPPSEQLGQIADLSQQGFFAETITSFDGWDIPFDGGSYVFFFGTSSGLRFDIVAANKAYWTEKDKAARMQPYFILTKGKFYRVEPKSEDEKKIISMIEAVLPQLTGTEKKSPQVAKNLVENIRSRKPLF